MGDNLLASRLFLVDALPYVFRAYFAIRDMSSPSGHPVNAVYGFTTFLLQLLQQEPITHLGIAFDQSLTTSFRNALYPAYKANRELPPADLERQLMYCQDVARALGAAVFVDQQYEADDLIGTLADQASRDALPVVLVTNDKDLMQLVTPNVILYDFAKKRRYDAAGVTSHMGVAPVQIPDLLGLQGDAVDNIPGVKGIGAKTAAALLQEFRDLDHIYQDVERIASLPLRGATSIVRKLREGREAAFLSKQLATIALDAPARYDAQHLLYRGASREHIQSLFEELGFRRLAQRITRWQS